MRVLQNRGLGYVAATLGIAAVTLIAALLRSHINEMTVALAMLLIVLFVAAAWGRWPGLAASLLGMLCLNYFFLPPLYTFTIADPQNWIALTAFFITALTAGQLSDWAKQRAAEAEAGRTQARLASTYNRSLLEASLDPLMTIGHDGKINDVNAAAETATGRSRAELIGTEFSKHFTEPQKARSAYEQVFHGDVVRSYPMQLLHRSGHSTSVLYDGSLYRDADGNVIGVVASTRPISTFPGSPLGSSPDPRVLTHLRLFIGFASFLSVAVGLLSLAGLTFHIAVLKSIAPGQPVIKFNAALCLILLGFALWLLRQHKALSSSGVAAVCGKLMAAVIVMVGLLSVTEHVTGVNLGLDQLLFHEPAADAFFSVRPGLMAPITALDLVFLGFALLLLDRPVTWKSWRLWPAEYLAFLTAVLSLLGVLDFVLGSHTPYTHIALQTAVVLQVLSIAVLCARTDRGLAALLASSTNGGVLIRRLLPAAIFIPIAIGVLGWRAFSAGLYTGWSVVSLMIIGAITLLAAFAILNGYIVDHGDLKRRKAEGVLHQRELELREAERLARMGSWWWDPKKDSVVWSAGLSQMAARDPLLPPLTYKEHLGFYTPASSARLDTATQSAIQTGIPYELDLEMVCNSGSVLSVTGRGEVESDADGNVVLVRGTVQDITERKRAEQALQKSADEIRDLYDHAPCGYHSVDSDGIFVRINETELSWLGYARDEMLGKIRFSDLLTPESRKTFLENFSKLKAQGVIRDLEFDMVRRDGTILPVLLSATAVTDSAGNYLMSRSTIYDITVRKHAESEIRMLAHLQSVVADLGERALRGAPLSQMLDDAANQVAQALGVDYCKILELLPNRAALLMSAGAGWKPGYVGHATVGLGTDSQAGFTLLSGEPVVVEDLANEKRFAGTALLHDHEVVSGASVVLSTNEGPYGVLAVHARHRRIFTTDEVNFLQAVANVLGSVIERHRAEKQLWRVHQAQRVLSKCNEALIRATEQPALLQQICDIIVEEAGYRLCWVGRAENDEAKSVSVIAQAGFEAGYLATLNITWADTERGLGPTGTCIRTRETAVTKNIATDPRMVPWRAEALKRGYGSSVSIPLIVESQAFGAIMIYAAEPDGFGTEEVRLLTELANDLAFGIGTLRTRGERVRAIEEIRTLNAELEQRVVARTAELQTVNTELELAHERESEIGFRIQQTLLLDRAPEDIPGLRVAALTVPTQRIDGDFYVFIKQGNQALDVIVGDVMGKGIPAALLGAATKSHFLKALSDLMALSKDGTAPQPRDVVMLAHAGIVRHLIELESFVTVCYARFDLSRHMVDFVDCGHTGIVHLHRKTGLCDVLHGDNLPMGVREGEIYEQVSVPFEPGDLLLLYSDGITEARNPGKELFGLDRLEECLRTNSGLAPAALVEAIRKSVFAFSESDRLADDLTSVAVQVELIETPVARADLDIQSDLKELRRVRAFVRGLNDGPPGPLLDEESESSLELAVNEAASNIMKHAYHGRVDQSIHLEGEAYPDRLLIRLLHSGDPFEPSMARPPALDGSRESGFGAYIIAQSLDDVRYYRDEKGRNCVAMVKRCDVKKESEN